jgi:hypothetical protein
MLDEIKSIKSTKKELKKFGLTVGIALLVLGGILFLLKKSFFHCFPGTGGVLILLALVLPVVLLPLQKLWMAFSIVMGWVMTRVILTILYYLVLTPISLVARLTGKQFLELKWNRSQSSYWNYRERREFKKEDFEKQF